MSFIGKPVYHVSDCNAIQFGNVVDQQERGTWTWVRVDWKTNTPTNTYNVSTKDVESSWFRIDTVKFFKPSEMINELQTL